jgi:hypothetical protein
LHEPNALALLTGKPAPAIGRTLSGIGQQARNGMTRNATMTIVTRRRLLLIGAVLVGAGVSGAAKAETGSVEIKITSAGFIVGGGGGSGVLVFKGQRYPFSVGGVAAGGIGAFEADLVGTASNLNNPRDFEGVYTAVSAGAAVASGKSVAELVNPHGVVLKLHGRLVGFKLGASLGGITITLK